MIRVTFPDNVNDIVSIEKLHQWDVGQSLQISGLDLPVAPEVHFATKVEDIAYVVQSELSNGNITVVIPDKVLKHGYPIVAYVYYDAGLDKKTIKSVTIPIIKRTKPADWKETLPSDILEVENYLEKIENDLNVLDVDYQAFKRLVTSYNIPQIRDDLDVVTDRLNNLDTGLSNKTTVFNADGSITETTADEVKTFIFNSDGTITETTVKNGTTVVKTTYFDADGTIREVIS